MADIERLLETLAAEAAPVKTAPPPRVVLLRWLGAATVYLGVTVAAFGVRPDLALKVQEPWFVAELLSLLVMIVTTAFSAALLAFPDVYQTRRAALLPLVGLASFLAIIFLAWRADSPPAPLPLHSFQCTLSIALLALPPAVLGMLALRRFASTHPRLAGSAALSCAFSVSALWLRLHEVNDSIIHVIGWHYLPMLVVGLAGLWVGKQVLKW